VEVTALLISFRRGRTGTRRGSRRCRNASETAASKPIKIVRVLLADRTNVAFVILVNRVLRRDRDALAIGSILSSETVVNGLRSGRINPAR